MPIVKFPYTKKGYKMAKIAKKLAKKARKKKRKKKYY